MKIQERELFEQYKQRVMDNIFTKPGLYQDIKELEDFIKLVEFTEQVIKEQDKFTAYLANSLNEKDKEIHLLKTKLNVMRQIALTEQLQNNRAFFEQIEREHKQGIEKIKFAKSCKILDDLENESTRTIKKHN